MWIPKLLQAVSHTSVKDIQVELEHQGYHLQSMKLRLQRGPTVSQTSKFLLQGALLHLVAVKSSERVRVFLTPCTYLPETYLLVAK